MLNIAIISGSIRIGRQSHKVALYFHNYITEHQLANSEIIDLKEYNFPVFEERLSFTANPTDAQKLFSEKISKADAVIVVSPEYNSGYPASIKNAIDLLYNEWYHKPIGIATASSGGFGGVNALALLQNIFLKVRAVPIAVPFPVPVVQNSFDDNGVPTNKEATDKRAATFLKELLWYAEAFNKMK